MSELALSDLNVFWYGFALAAILAWPLFQLLIRLNSRQRVSEYAPETHQAKQGTPTMGGLLFVIPFLYFAAAWHAYFAGLLVGLFAAIGFVDDFVVPRLVAGKRGLGWKQKLIAQFAAAVIACRFQWARFPNWDVSLSQMGLEVFLILFAANAYNFADGLDGLASSVGLLMIPGLVVINVVSGHEMAVAPLVVLAGSMIPFAFLNAPKAKVFMGDVGSLAVGALIGASLWPVGPPIKQAHLSNVILFPGFHVVSGQFILGCVALSMVLVIELAPVPLQIFWVKVFKKRLFPFTPIHHAFEKAGWPETRVVWMFALLQLLCTLACISLCWPDGWRGSGGGFHS